MIRAFSILVIIVGVGLAYFAIQAEIPSTPHKPVVITPNPSAAPSTPGVKPGASIIQIPKAKTLITDYYVSQTFNNCAPAALSMALAHYGINVSQEALAESLRPVNNLSGKNDDKSTTPDELGREAEKYGLVSYYRPHGNTEMVKQFIANDIPVVVRTLLHANEDYAHYRVVKGYDDVTGHFIEDDGYEGKNIRFTYAKFDELWQPFNYSYLVLVRPEKKKIAESIIGGDLNSLVAWQNAVDYARKELADKPADLDAAYNLSVALYYTGQYAESVATFEKIESRLAEHTMWYQIEPIQAYFEAGNYARVFELSDRILNNKNPAYSELYLLRGYSYLKQNDIPKAREEFERAVQYNKNLRVAQEALASVSE